MTYTPADSAGIHARRFLRELDASLPIELSSAHPAAEWARSGAMWLTARSEGPPQIAPGAPASALRAALAVLRAATGRDVPGVELLGERAACAGLTRRAPGSPGGAFRALRARDGWLGLSIPRQTDVESLTALTESTDPIDPANPWLPVRTWLAQRSVEQAARRAHLLGLAASPVGVRSSRPGVVVTRGGGPRRDVSRPLIVDLTSLWAGPLCAHLLAHAGARVIKVESIDRPDGARFGAPAFYDLLHGGLESVGLDFSTQRHILAALVSRADVVLEASRPRALRQLDIRAEDFVAGGGIWCSITAYGRTAEARVGFGDDVAAGAGLVAWTDGHPYPVGDAIADPLAGAHAAAALGVALRGDHGCLLDVSMHDVAAAAANLPAGTADIVGVPGGWEVDASGHRVAVQPPRARELAARAAPLGSDTVAVLNELKIAL